MNAVYIGIALYLSGGMMVLMSWLAGITEGAVSRRFLYGMSFFALSTLLCMVLNYQVQQTPQAFQQVQITHPIGDRK